MSNPAHPAAGTTPPRRLDSTTEAPPIHLRPLAPRSPRGAHHDPDSRTARPPPLALGRPDRRAGRRPGCWTSAPNETRAWSSAARLGRRSAASCTSGCARPGAGGPALAGNRARSPNGVAGRASGGAGGLTRAAPGPWAAGWPATLPPTPRSCWHAVQAAARARPTRPEPGAEGGRAGWTTDPRPGPPGFGARPACYGRWRVGRFALSVLLVSAGRPGHRGLPRRWPGSRVGRAASVGAGGRLEWLVGCAAGARPAGGPRATGWPPWLAGPLVTARAGERRAVTCLRVRKPTPTCSGSASTTTSASWPGGSMDPG